MLRASLALLALSTLALAAPAGAQGPLAIAIEPPAEVREGDRIEIVARLSGAGDHPVLVTPRSEGTAIEVVRGRLLRADARDPRAVVLELRIPIVARAPGAAVLRVSAAGYACEPRCRLVEAEASIALHVAPAHASRDKRRTKQASDEAPAGARTSSLSWVRLPGTEPCAASPQLARMVEARLSRSVFVSAADADLAVEGRAEREDGVWRAVLQVTDERGESLGERTLESRAESCEELGELVAVTVALMIDPLTAPSETPDPPTEPRVIVRTETVVERVEVPVAAEEPARPGWRLEIDSAVVGALGLTPTATIGGTAAVILEPPGFVPVLVEGTLLPFSRADGGGGHADFLHVHAGLQICPLALRERGIALHGCLGADAGAVLVVGGDLAVDEGERLIGQGHVALRGHFDLVGPLTLRVGLHLLIPFRHEAFTVGGNPLYVPEPVAGLLDLGVGLHFD